MSEDFDFDFPFEVNYDKVFKTNSVLPMARLLAATLMENPYMTVGTYMQKARDSELALIMEISEDEEDERMGDLLLMSEMLSRAEGVDTPDIETVQGHLQAFISVAAITSLHRKDLLDAHYENMSFGEEFNKHIIAKRKPNV
jgi:hypothetical protein